MKKKNLIITLIVMFLLVGCGGTNENETSASSEEATKLSTEERIKEAGYSTYTEVGRRTFPENEDDIYFYIITFENTDNRVFLSTNVDSNFTPFAISITNDNEDVSKKQIFWKNRYNTEGKPFEAYEKVLEDIGITKDEFMDYLSDLSESIEIPEEVEEWKEEYYSDDSTDSTPPSSSTNSSSSTDENETNQDSTSEADVEAAIKKVDEKYDEMIQKAQGYVDNPSRVTQILLP